LFNIQIFLPNRNPVALKKGEIWEIVFEALEINREEK
jgi:hypothetical protein